MNQATTAIALLVGFTIGITLPVVALLTFAARRVHLRVRRLEADLAMVEKHMAEDYPEDYRAHGAAIDGLLTRMRNVESSAK